MKKTTYDIACQIADMIHDNGLEFGTGRFRDIELVLDAAVKLGVADLECDGNLFNEE